jgi:hypothetical protein
MNVSKRPKTKYLRVHYSRNSSKRLQASGGQWRAHDGCLHTWCTAIQRQEPWAWRIHCLTLSYNKLVFCLWEITWLLKVTHCKHNREKGPDNAQRGPCFLVYPARIHRATQDPWEVCIFYWELLIKPPATSAFPLGGPKYWWMVEVCLSPWPPCSTTTFFPVRIPHRPSNCIWKGWFSYFDVPSCVCLQKIQHTAWVMVLKHAFGVPISESLWLPRFYIIIHYYEIPQILTLLRRVRLIFILSTSKSLILSSKWGVSISVSSKYLLS